MTDKTANHFDIIVIGAGPGGYVAAIRAAQLGMKAAIIEKADMGGICLNWGCIPTKAMLRSAEMYAHMKNAGHYGLSANPSFDLAAIVKRSRDIAGRLSSGIDFLMKKNKITVIRAAAGLEASDGGAPHVTAGDETHTADNVILATGARPRTLENIGAVPDGKSVWTSREAMVPESLPETLLVVGSGAIGLEFASFYNSLGTQVTVVEVMGRILPQEDAEIAELAMKSFQKRGVNIMAAAELQALTPGKKGVDADILQGDETHKLTFDKVVLAIGVTANTENMGLEALGVELEKGAVKTDGVGATNIPGLYAIGDVTAPPWLAHKASHEAVICVEAIAGLAPHRLDRNKIPACTYCAPQIASVGLTEEKALAKGKEIRIGRFPFQANGKALAMGETEGMAKVVFCAKTGELLGAHLIGAEVTELIQGFAIAIGLETTEEELMQTVFPHPTLSETMHEAVLDAYDRMLHL